MPPKTDRGVLFAKTALFALSLTPLLLLAWRIFQDDLGPNPVETLQRNTGIWTLNFLLLTLAISPIRSLAGMPVLVRFRRMLGLFTFFYGTVHLLSFAGFDHGFELDSVWRDVTDRRFIAVGFAAWVLLGILAATSFNRIIRAMGGSRWQSLHRSNYLIAILACTHFYWLSKGTALLWPIGYGLIVSVLLGWRVWNQLRPKPLKN